MSEPKLPQSLNIPWPVIISLVTGLAGGGASGALLSRPVVAAVPDSVTQAEVEHIVEVRLAAHDEYLLQKIELMLAKEKLAHPGTP